MKKKKTGAALPVWVALACLLLMGIAELVLWLLSGYAPLLALALVQLLPAAVNLLVSLPLGKTRPLAAMPEVPEGKKKNIWKCAVRGLANLLRRLGNFWHSHRQMLLAALLLGAVMALNCCFWPNVQAASETGRLAYWMPVVLVACFVISVALEKICSHVTAKETLSPRWSALAENLKGALLMGRVGQVLTAAAMVLTLTGLYDPQLIVQIALALLFVYETALLVLSIAIRLIRKELNTAPKLPLSAKAMGQSGILSYLEENTGITMRSLWSIGFIRQLLPGVVLFVVLLTWLFSGMTQIDAHQEGALYRLGKLQPDSLKPGIHLTLPWPFDKVEVYDTQSLRKVVVGYTPDGEVHDNTWTGNHSLKEHHLLLGGGNEMVAINLQVEYRICDLNRYLRSSASAESLLTASAYEIVTARTIATDIDTLLSADRTVFSQTFHQELSQRVDGYDLGIEVTNVVLENIHPPVQVAGVYQDVISAGIYAKQLILEAQREAILTTSLAQHQAQAEVNSATCSMIQQVAAAKGSVSEFMAAVEAYNSEPSAYTYYKYMNALTDAYGKGVLVLVGEDVDDSALVIGDLVRPPEEVDPYYVEPEVEEEYLE